jgi:uncharacterized membrane protein
VLNLDYNTAGALVYLPICFVGVLASAVFWRTEPARNHELRFNALQSLMLTGVLIVLAMGCGLGMAIFALIPLIHYVMVPLFSLSWMACMGAYMLLSIVLMMKAYKGEIYKLPFIGDIAAAKASFDPNA